MKLTVFFVTNAGTGQNFRCAAIFPVLRALWLIRNLVKVIAENNWSWMLYQDHSSYIVSVLCGSAGMYTQEIVLSPEEESSYLCQGKIVLDKLAASVRSNPDEYKDRKIEGFHSNENAKTAARVWRLKHAQKP